MGSWSESCGISNITISEGTPCVILPLKVGGRYEGTEYLPATLPIFGTYNDYGGMEDIEEDDNTKFIEEHFGVSIDDFVEYLVDGKHTYDRNEAKETAKKFELNGKLKEAEPLRFMWIHRKVYDFVKGNLDSHEKGHIDFGGSEMLASLGFTEVKTKGKIKNYDPKRFNKKWKNGKVTVFSDGKTMLSEKGKYIFYFGKGCESSIETYIEVPEELQHLKQQTQWQAWRTMDERAAKQELQRTFGIRDNMFSEALPGLLEAGDILSTVSILKHRFANQTIDNKYINDRDTFGDRIADLITIRNNIYAMSKAFKPHVLYQTPQCGGYKIHQLMLEEFCKINKEHIYEEDGD